MPVPRAWIDRASVGSWAVPASLLLVAAVSPFERPLPGSLFGFTLTTLELSVLSRWPPARLRDARAGGASLAHADHDPLFALLACAMVSSLAAPEFRGNALRFAGRLPPAILLFTLAAMRRDVDRLRGRSSRCCSARRHRRRHRRARARAGAGVLDALEGVPSRLSRRRRTTARDVDAVLSDHHVDVSRSGVRARPDVDRIKPPRVRGAGPRPAPASSPRSRAPD